MLGRPPQATEKIELNMILGRSPKRREETTGHRPNGRSSYSHLEHGTMTGRTAELNVILENRRINICCVQETK